MSKPKPEQKKSAPAEAPAAAPEARLDTDVVETVPAAAPEARLDTDVVETVPDATPGPTIEEVIASYQDRIATLSASLDEATGAGVAASNRCAELEAALAELGQRAAVMEADIPASLDRARSVGFQEGAAQGRQVALLEAQAAVSERLGKLALFTVDRASGGRAMVAATSLEEAAALVRAQGNEVTGVAFANVAFFVA